MNFLIIIGLLEGFTTLAVQIISMRAAVPIVGSSIILTSIYIGIILMALSTGYYIGGVMASRYKKERLPLLLFGYLLFSGLYYAIITFSMHQPILEWFLTATGSYIGTLFITAIILFFLPVCIASQTIPLLTEMTSIDSKGRAAGSMLFRSTVGSFIGSVGTSIFLFQEFGVFQTSKIVVIIMMITACLSLMLYKKKWGYIALGVTAIASTMYFTMYQNNQEGNFVFDSAYQEIVVRDISLDGEPGKVFHTNAAYASAIFTRTKESPFGYIREAVNLTKTIQPKNVLVLGTAGFTYPNEISSLPYVEKIDAIDIDPSVKRIAEEHFLEKKLSDKVTFYPESARYFVNQAIASGKKYELIFVDAFNGKYLPDELVTQEFYASLGKLTNPENIISNMILDSSGDSMLSRSITTTMESVLGPVFGKNVSGNEDAPIVNLVVTGKKFSQDYKLRQGGGTIYTDDKRNSELDLVSMQNWDN